MKNKIAVTMVAAGLMIIGGIAQVNASEVTGTLSSGGTTTDQTFSVQSAPTQTVSSGGGGGGGSIVPPSASYAYGGGVNYATKPVNLNSTSAPTENSNISTTGNGRVLGASTYRPIAQAGLYNSAPTTNDDSEIATDTATSSATITESTVDTGDIMATTTPDIGTTGPYDFLGISVWFWLVLLVLVILIIAVLYMQSL